MNLSNFGMDVITLGGTLEAKLAASKRAGFTQIMLWARDLTGHPLGIDAAVAAVKASGQAVTGIQVMRDYEGLSGTLHAYKLDVAKSMLQVCKAVGAPMMMVCSSTSRHAVGDFDKLAEDLSKLATLAIPLGIKIGYEALSWGAHVYEYQDAWAIVELANHQNLYTVIDSYHILASGNKNGSNLDALANIDAQKIGLVQLADFMWADILNPNERIETARHMRVFPGEGAHSAELIELLRTIDGNGYRGSYSFEVFNDDFAQMPLDTVAARAKNSAKWVTDQVLRRSLPLLS